MVKIHIYPIGRIWPKNGSRSAILNLNFPKAGWIHATKVWQRYVQFWEKNVTRFARYQPRQTEFGQKLTDARKDGGQKIYPHRTKKSLVSITWYVTFFTFLVNDISPIEDLYRYGAYRAYSWNAYRTGHHRKLKY